MKHLSFSHLKFSIFIAFSLVSLQLMGQKIHVDYVQTEGLPNRFTVEVWVSSPTEGDQMYLSALNTVFEYSNDVFVNGELEFKLAPKFSTMSEPITNVVKDRNKLRSTMIPVKSADYAVKLSKKPELFGTLTFENRTSIEYPQVILPSSTGNPTLQALVYEGKSINSTAVTLSQSSITTDENPLVLRLMPTKLNVQPALQEIDIYPNPTTNQLYYNVASDIDNPIQEISVTDAHGRIIMQLTESLQFKGSVDLTSYAPGIYYLSIKQNERVLRHRVIKI